MELHAHLRKARDAAKAAAKARRAKQVFHFHWGSSESEYVTGWDAACARLSMKPQSLAVRLSASRNAYSTLQVNPVTGEPDTLTVSKLVPDKEAKRQRGRPAKQIDWERLGSEAPDYRPKR